MAQPPRTGFYVALREPSHFHLDKDGNELWHVYRRWHVRRGRLPQNQHDTNFGETDINKRTITIHTPLADDDFWSTLRHEVDHVSYPFLDELWVSNAEINWEAVRSRLVTEDD